MPQADVRQSYQEPRASSYSGREPTPHQEQRPGGEASTPELSVKSPAPAHAPDSSKDALRLPGTPKPNVVVPVLWFVPVTVRDADVLWIVVPRTPAQIGRAPLLSG